MIPLLVSSLIQPLFMFCPSINNTRKEYLCKSKHVLYEAKRRYVEFE